MFENQATTTSVSETDRLMNGAAMHDRDQRSWRELLAKAGSAFLKRSGVSSALLGGAMSLNDAVLPERAANADLTLSGQPVGPYLIAGAQNAGFRTATGGGSFFIEMQGVFPGLGAFTRVASAIDLGPIPGRPGFGTAIAPAHVLPQCSHIFLHFKLVQAPII
jgi:hypothetical protein